MVESPLRRLAVLNKTNKPAKLCRRKTNCFENFRRVRSRREQFFPPFLPFAPVFRKCLLFGSLCTAWESLAFKICAALRILASGLCDFMFRKDADWSLQVAPFWLPLRMQTKLKHSAILSHDLSSQGRDSEDGSHYKSKFRPTRRIDLAFAPVYLELLPFTCFKWGKWCNLLTNLSDWGTCVFCIRQSNT